MSTLSALAETCVSLRSLGHRIVIVSSGAIGMGLHRMELPALVGKKGSSRTMGEKQALAAIGQGRLIALWDQIFGALKQPIAQILLTRNDIADVSTQHRETALVCFVKADDPVHSSHSDHAI